MTIKITRPEVEAFINEQLASGAYLDAEDVLVHALRLCAAETLPLPKAASAPDIVDLFAPLRGIDLDWGRNAATGRPLGL